MKILLRFIICICFLILSINSTAIAQSSETTPKTDQSASWLDGENITVKAGLSQPLLLSGVNLAVTYMTDRLVFEYSHGVWLSYDRIGRTDTERNQNLDLYSPWSTGFGIGYRLGLGFDVRVELKAHRYRVTRPVNESFEYTTFSIGPAINFHQPLYKGLGLDLTVRFWPNVASTLQDGQRTFVDAEGQAQIHEAHDLGVFPNVSLGYTF